MNIKTNFSILALLLLLLTGFQNCQPGDSSRMDGTDGTKAFNQDGESGTPYEGKIYAHLGGHCNDGTELQSRIVISSSMRAQVNRNNCQDIEPVDLATNDYQLNSESETLIYQNQNYKFIGVVAVFE